MQSLQFISPGRIEWHERPEPLLTGPGQAIVRPLAASICDIDRPVLTGNSPWSGPLRVRARGCRRDRRPLRRFDRLLDR